MNKAYANVGTSTCIRGIDNALQAFEVFGDPETGKLVDAISDGFYGNKPDVIGAINDSLGINEVKPGSVAGNISPEQFPA